MNWIVFDVFPREFVFALAGLARYPRLPTASILRFPTAAREAAAITFVVTASGLSLFGIGAAFRGVLAGVVSMLVLRPQQDNK